MPISQQRGPAAHRRDKEAPRARGGAFVAPARAHFVIPTRPCLSVNGDDPLDPVACAVSSFSGSPAWTDRQAVFPTPGTASVRTKTRRLLVLPLHE
jgi:hypothetical protein